MNKIMEVMSMINKRCAALVMAAIMAASSAMPAMAEVSIDGNDGYESGTTVDSVTASDEEADAAGICFRW